MHIYSYYILYLFWKNNITIIIGACYITICNSDASYYKWKCNIKAFSTFKHVVRRVLQGSAMWKDINVNFCLKLACYVMTNV